MSLAVHFSIPHPCSHMHASQLHFSLSRNRCSNTRDPAVFRWYVDHGLPVTPINPGAPAINVDGKDYPTAASLSALQEPEGTAVSIITAPPVTKKTLEEAKSLGINAVFLQPGTFDDDVEAYARENFATVLAGKGGAGGEGWCVLVDGKRGLQAAGKL